MTGMQILHCGLDATQVLWGERAANIQVKCDQGDSVEDAADSADDDELHAVLSEARE
jgi:hypothetical protein